MEPEIHPEPSEQERAAILEALASEGSGEGGKRSAWWRAGVAENVRAEAELAED